jgi:hypothetical protein
MAAVAVAGVWYAAAKCQSESMVWLGFVFTSVLVCVEVHSYAFG